MSYNLWLVALSFVVAALASLTALDLAGRVRATQGRARYIWLCGGAVAMGTGIWSMHFIGMLALHMPGTMGYDIPLTLISMLAAVLSSVLALRVVCEPRPTTLRLGVGGTVMGFGVCLMHYVGMEAMEVSAPISYRPALFLASVIIAILAATAALWLAFKLNEAGGGKRTPFLLRGASSLVMAVAIAGMHYTGMAAAILDPSAMDMGPVEEAALTPGQMAMVIAGISGAIMLVVLMLAVYDSHLSSRTARLAASLKAANLELRAMVRQDPLTRLPNRLLLEQKLDETLELARRESHRFAVLFVDLDRFKAVNDSMGHHVGDQLLKRVADRLKDVLDEEAIVARVGGDEFLIITRVGTDRRQAEITAERITGSLGMPFKIQEKMPRISASVGISLYPDHGDNGHELMIHADAAMYHAKDMGRNNYQLYQVGMSSLAARRTRLEQRLRIAIEQDGLSLAYQPKVDVHTGIVSGVEALLRWEDEELGVVNPDEIIPIAEDTGLIIPIGEWVLRTACRQVEIWYTQGMRRIPVAVNLSVIQLNSLHFVSMVKKVLEETGLPRGCLEFELTESAILQSPDKALSILQQLRQLGVSLSIDDFGTGYSNLAQLKRFPIDRLKVDRSFTAGVISDQQDAAIVRAVIMLAHSLDMEIVAEGVETAEQLEFIRNLKGKHYQGYYYSKPLTANQLAEKMGRESRVFDHVESL